MSLAEMWAEYYDQSNGLGNDSEQVKWLIGKMGLEGLPEHEQSSAYKQPDRMLSSSTISFK